MNEGHTTKHPQRQGKEVMIGVETTKGYLAMRFCAVIKNT